MLFCEERDIMETQSLRELLYTNLNWHPARISTFSELIFSVVKTRTVKIKELALNISSKGTIKAKIAKIERLFLKQDFDYTTIGRTILTLLNKGSKISIAIDRTNWQFGAKDLNFLVASIIDDNISIPISWKLLDKKGNSNTSERKALIEEILQIIPAENIGIIVADREFVGEDWFSYLSQEKKLPFAIRLKKCELLRHPNGGKLKIGKYFADVAARERKTLDTKIYDLNLKITCLGLEKEHLFIASNSVVGDDALICYKQRWSIERTFKSIKTSGFNIEDTHMSDLSKLRKLFGILSLALTICVIAGKIKNDIISIVIKKHGRKLCSLFTYGFDWLRDCLNGSKNSQVKILSRKLRRKIKQASK